MIKKIVSFSFLTFISLISFAPFYFLVMMSTQYSEDIFKGNIYWPGSYLLENLNTVLQSNFLQALWNSVVVSVSSTLLGVFISALTGFALAKYNFKFKKAFFTFILLSMMIPSQIGLIGYIIEMRVFGLTGTLLPLIIVWMTNAFGVFWMYQYIKGSVHNELIESARIDGCSEPSIFVRIIIPVITPAIMTLSIVIFLWSWNNYLLPLVTIFKEELYTVPLVINRLGYTYRVDYGARLLALLICILPLIVLFLIGSKNFIRGLTSGAVKG
jgi:cellobiose transport system permease protein